MSVEVIINYTENNSESELDKTLKSLKLHGGNYITTVSVCVHPPHNFRSTDRFMRKIRHYFGENTKWNMHLLASYQITKEVINFAAEKSLEKYYMFLNCGHTIKDDILLNLENDVLFIDPEDHDYNGFVCNVQVHKTLLGFGSKYSLIEKIEELLKRAKENGTNIT